MKYVILLHTSSIHSYLCEYGPSGRSWGELRDAMQLDLRGAESIMNKEVERGDLVSNARTLKIIPADIAEVMEL